MSKSQAEKAYEYDRTREALAKKGRTAGLAYEVDRLLRGTPYLYPSVNIKLDPACPPGKVFARNPAADRPTDSINGCEVSFVAFDESYVSPMAAPTLIYAFLPGQRVRVVAPDTVYAGKTGLVMGAEGKGYRVEIISAGRARKLYFSASELAFVEPTPSFPVGSTVALKSNGRRATVTCYSAPHHVYTLHFHDCSNDSLECYPYAGEQLVAATPAPVDAFKIGDRVQSVRFPKTFGVVTAQPSSDSVVVLWGDLKYRTTYRGERELKWLRSAPAAEPRPLLIGDRVYHTSGGSIQGEITHRNAKYDRAIVLYDNGLSHGYSNASKWLRHA